MEKPDNNFLTDRRSIMVQVAANMPAALKDLKDSNPELAQEIGDRQHAVAETRRRGQANPDLLNMRFLGRASLAE